MTLPTTGPISLAQIRAELGIGGVISLSRSEVRNLAGIATGTIGMASLRGKTGPGSGPAFSVMASNGAAFGDATGAQFTAHATPSVAASGGTAPFSYVWTIAIQDDSGFAVTSANAATCDVSHTIGKYGYIGECTLTCIVNDNAGNTVTKTGILASFSYEQNSDGTAR